MRSPEIAPSRSPKSTCTSPSMVYSLATLGTRYSSQHCIFESASMASEIEDGPLSRRLLRPFLLVIPVVPKVGLEPTLPCGNRILSPARLPISPLRLLARVSHGAPAAAADPFAIGYRKFKQPPESMCVHLMFQNLSVVSAPKINLPPPRVERNLSQLWPPFKMLRH